MKKITDKIIKDFRNYLINEEKASATVEKYIRDLKAFSVWLKNAKLCKEKELTKSEYERLLSAAKSNGNRKLFLLMQGTLLKHLAEIDETCHNCLKDMMSKMTEQESVTEQLKAINQMLWVQKMNSIKSRAEEFILKEYVMEGLTNEENSYNFSCHINNGKCGYSYGE